jgi:hypothetical protein
LEYCPFLFLLELCSLDATGVSCLFVFADAFFGGMALSHPVPVELMSFSVE